MTIGLRGLSLYIINNSGEFPKKNIKQNNYTYFPKENGNIDFCIEKRTWLFIFLVKNKLIFIIYF